MPAAALLAAANITISAIAPREASILGGTELTLTGSGFGSASSAATARCKFGWNWGGWAFNSTTEPFPPAVPTTHATVVSDSELRCPTPPVPNAGYVSVQVSVGGGSWGGEGVHDQPRLRFFAPFSAAVHRRPYTHEEEVRLLLNIHPTVGGKQRLQVSATVRPSVRLRPHTPHPAHTAHQAHQPPTHTNPR